MAIDGEGGDGGAGGSADLLGGGDGGGSGGEGSGGEGGGSAGEGGGFDGGEGGDPDFLGLLSAEGGDADNPANRDWVKAKGFKDLDSVIKSYRAAEKAIHDKGGIKVPGEGATAEEIAAYQRAIGVPEAVAGYEIKPIENGKFDPNRAEGPDNPKHIPLNEPLIEALRASALKHGTPASAFQGLVQDYVAMQMDETAAEDAKQNGLAQAKIKEWGAASSAKIAAVDSAARALGLTSAEMKALRSAWGADRALDRLAHIGEGITEDTLITGGRGRFGITGAEAQSELDKLNADPEHMKAVQRKDPATLARRQRLIDAVAADRDAKAKA